MRCGPDREDRNPLEINRAVLLSSMSHRIAIARQLRDYLSIVFLAFFGIIAGMIYYASGAFDLIITGCLAALGTSFAAFRAYGPIKKDFARARMLDWEDSKQIEAKQQAERDDIFGTACIEIAKMMSKLSDGDLSVFITADQFHRQHEDKHHQFMTSKGSAVHLVLVGMVDVGAARPIEMKRFAPETDLALATYELTSWGRQALRLFIRDAFRFRNERT